MWHVSQRQTVTAVTLCADSSSEPQNTWPRRPTAGPGGNSHHWYQFALGGVLGRVTPIRQSRVTSSASAASSISWAPSGRRIEIPYGISDVFREADPPTTPPAPRAVFTSSPLRSPM